MITEMLKRKEFTGVAPRGGLWFVGVLRKLQGKIDVETSERGGLNRTLGKMKHQVWRQWKLMMRAPLSDLE